AAAPAASVPTDRAGGKVAGRVAVGSQPYCVALAGGSLWVGDHGSRDVRRVDPGTASVTANLPIGMRPWRMAASAKAIWVVSYEDSIVVRIDVATGGVTA